MSRNLSALYFMTFALGMLSIPVTIASTVVGVFSAICLKQAVGKIVTKLRIRYSLAGKHKKKADEWLSSLCTLVI